MKQAAAIQRASQQARNAMYALDAQGVADLLLIYEQAATEVRGRLAHFADASNMVPTHKLQALLRQIDEVIDALGEQRDQLLRTAIDQAAELGVRPFSAQGVLAVGGSQAVLDSAAAMRIHEQAVRFVMEFTQADGLTLSDRLWRLDRGAKEALGRAIGQAVVQGQSAAQAAQQFLMRGEAIPGDVAQRVARSRVPALVTATDLLTNSRNGGYAQAERVMRTEINRAHGEAFMAAGEGTPGFAGWRYLLSPRHPKPDVCLRAGTLVTTRRGPVPIEQVRVGDEALTHLGRWRPVVRLYRSASGPSELVRLCFPAANSRIREVVMTPNHPVLTPSGWTAAGDLQTGSHVVCLVATAALPPQLCGAGANRTALAGSAGTASTGAARKTGPEQCDAGDCPARCTSRTVAADSFLPNGLPSSGAARRLWSGFRRAMPGFLPAYAGQTFLAEPLPCAETCLGDACHSSDCQRPSSACTPGSNISGPCCIPSSQTTLRMPNTPVAWWRGLGRSIRLSSTHWPVPSLSTAEQGIPCHTPGRKLQPASHAPSIAPSRRDCKSVWWSFASPAPTVGGWVSAASRSVRRVLIQASGKNNLFATQHAVIDRLAATGETVFNLEVEDDHSYVGNGLVVHNCDLLSTQNLHGLGDGVYPSRAATPWPAHPNTLSFVEMVFVDEVNDADRAGKETSLQALQRLAPEIRAGALGQTKAAYFDRGLLRTGMIRAPLYAVEQRLQRRGQI